VSKYIPKVIRDPVHGIIPFEDTPCDRLLLDLINTREFQRLRRIKQLGMSELVFPGANHSRFAHCIGTMHVARLMLRQVAQTTGRKLKTEEREAVLVAALLHDVGHGPFSHAFEKVTRKKHEARTLEILTDRKTEISKRLRKHNKDLPGRLEVFFDEDIDAEKRKEVEIPGYLTQVVSSQLDADRFDYLLRDSHATGTDYGRFDLNWLILQLMIDKSRKRFFLSRKAVSAAEGYVFARYHMYRSVYFHKAVRAAEVMLHLIFRRFKELLQQASSNRSRNAIVPDASRAVLSGFGEDLPLDCFLALDDHAMSEFFKACAKSNDSILAQLGSGLTERRLYKGLDVTDFDPAKTETFKERAINAVKKSKLDPSYAFVSETAADTPYKPYYPDQDRPASQIYVELGDGRQYELSGKSDAVRQLRHRYTLLRYYYPESLRKKIERIAKATIAKEERP